MASFVRSLSIGLVAAACAAPAIAQNNRNNRNNPGPGPAPSPAPSTSPSTPPAANASGPRFIFRATAFSNMEIGWQITLEGTRYLLSANGQPVMGGEILMADAVAAPKLAPSPGATGPMIELKLGHKYKNDGALNATGDQQGILKICVPQETDNMKSDKIPFDSLNCRDLKPNVPRSHDDRNHQFLGANVTWVVENGSVRIKRWNDGKDVIGREGTNEAPSMTIYHPVRQAQAPGKAFKDNRSPLVLDIDGSGDVDLTDIWSDQHAVSFDLEGEGIKNRTGWVQPQDALLCIDRDGDGKIGDGRELFGDFSWGYELETKVRRRFANGFAALAQYDYNKDGQIDVNDPAFTYIKLWQDKNQNGISESEELKPVSSAVTSISLAYVKNMEGGIWKVNRGNEVRYTATYKHVSGKERVIADVYFNQDRQKGVARADASATDANVQEVKP